MPSTSVVVPVGERSATLDRCLESLVALDPAPAEVILVVDGVPPDDLPPAGTEWAVVCLSERSGPAAARNAGAEAATGDVLLFLDADVVVPPDLVRRVADAFERDDTLTALIGSYDDEPADSGFLSQYRNLLHHFVHQRSGGEASTFWGACGAVRRSAFEAVDGFDPRYHVPSVEDIELGYRMRERGYRIELDPTLQVKHLKKWTPLGMIRTDVLHRGIPWTLLLLRRRSAERGLNLRTPDRLAVLLTPLSLLALVLGRPLVAAGTAGVVVLLDLPFLSFLQQHRGTRFAMSAAPLRWLFHLYSGVALVCGAAAYVTEVVTGRARAGDGGGGLSPGGRGGTTGS